MRRPNLYVLAGVNGAGKSSLGGLVLRDLGLKWYNPDTVARALVEDFGLTQQEANIEAWKDGMAQLDQALAERRRFAFETTLGGRTVFEKLRTACATHNVRIWFCGLASPDLHLARVRLRVARGGHDIPPDKIFERWEKSRHHLIELMSGLAELGVFDNSQSVKPGELIPEPRKLLHLRDGVILYPDTVAALRNTPEWAQAIVQAARELTAR